MPNKKMIKRRIQKKYKRKMGRGKPKNNKKGIKRLFQASPNTYNLVPDPFPARLLVRLKYAAKGSLYSNNLAIDTFGNEHVYRLTNIYDPYYNLGDSTVVGHAQLAAIYQKYIVYGAKVEIEFYDPVADGGVPGVSLNQAGTLQNSTLKVAGEHMLTYTGQINNTGSQKKKFHFYVKPWALSGLSKLEWMANKSTRSSAMGTGPTEETFIRLAYAHSTNTSSEVEYTIRIIYYTELFDRYQLTSTAHVY